MDVSNRYCFPSSAFSGHISFAVFITFKLILNSSCVLKPVINKFIKLIRQTYLNDITNNASRTSIQLRMQVKEKL